MLNNNSEWISNIKSVWAKMFSIFFFFQRIWIGSVILFNDHKKFVFFSFFLFGFNCYEKRWIFNDVCRMVGDYSNNIRFHTWCLVSLGIFLSFIFNWIGDCIISIRINSQLIYENKEIFSIIIGTSSWFTLWLRPWRWTYRWNWKHCVTVLIQTDFYCLVLV